jgi:hypothetical protein
LDITELSRRTKIERRKLRYILDHQLVPRSCIEIADNDAGRPRQFDELAGFGIVCAARLLDLGMPHESIRLFLGRLLDIINTYPPFFPLFFGGCPATAELGDGTHVRVEMGGHSSGWIPSNKARKRDNTFTPVAVVRLDIGCVRNQISRAK